MMAFSVTVAALGQDDVLVGADPTIDLGGVQKTRIRLHLEAELTQRLEVGFHRPGAEVAPSDVGEAELVELVQQGPQEHDHGAGAARCVEVHPREVEAGRGSDLEVVAVRQPAGLDADAGQHLEDPVDLFDPGQAAQRGACRG